MKVNDRKLARQWFEGNQDTHKWLESALRYYCGDTMVNYALHKVWGFMPSNDVHWHNINNYLVTVPCTSSGILGWAEYPPHLFLSHELGHLMPTTFPMFVNNLIYQRAKKKPLPLWSRLNVITEAWACLMQLWVLWKCDYGFRGWWNYTKLTVEAYWHGRISRV